MYDDELLMDWKELWYRGKNLVDIAKKLKISVSDLRKKLEIPWKEVGFLTTVRELQEAYQNLPDGKERNIVIERMENYCFKKLESIPKDMDHFFEIRLIYLISFEENKSRKDVFDWLDKISRDFLKMVTFNDKEEVFTIYKTADEIGNKEVSKLARNVYEKLFREFKKKEIENKLMMIERTNDLEGLSKLSFTSDNQEVNKKLFEKMERRCLEEATKAEVLKDYRRAKEIYLICSNFSKNYRFSSGVVENFVFDIWKNICLESEDETAVIEHLKVEDYDDGQSESMSNMPEANRILDEIFIRKIAKTETIEGFEELKRNYLYEGWFLKNKAGELADKKIKKIFLRKMETASEDEIIEMYKSPLASYEIKREMIKKIFGEPFQN